MLRYDVIRVRSVQTTHKLPGVFEQFRASLKAFLNEMDESMTTIHNTECFIVIISEAHIFGHTIWQNRFR